MKKNVVPSPSPAFSTDPECAHTVLDERQDVVATQTVRIIRIVSVVRELLRRRVKPVEPAAMGADPEHTRAVLDDRPDTVAA